MHRRGLHNHHLLTYIWYDIYMKILFFTKPAESMDRGTHPLFSVIVVTSCCQGFHPASWSELYIFQSVLLWRDDSSLNLWIIEKNVFLARIKVSKRLIICIFLFPFSLILFRMFYSCILRSIIIVLFLGGIVLRLRLSISVFFFFSHCQITLCVLIIVSQCVLNSF